MVDSKKEEVELVAGAGDVREKGGCIRSSSSLSTINSQPSTFSSSIHQRELEFGFGDDLAVDEAAAAGLADGAAHLDDLGLDEQGVARQDGAAPFDAVRAHEVTDFTGILRLAAHEDGGDLGHRLKLQHAGHDRVAGEVAGEIRLVDGDVFHSGALAVTEAVDDAVHHQERIAVRQDFEHLVDVQ